MMQTAEQLMSGCGLKVVYAYTQSDEISLLFGPDESGSGGDWASAVGPLGEAMRQFSLLLVRRRSSTAASRPGVGGDVVDYFRWRAEEPSATP